MQRYLYPRLRAILRAVSFPWTRRCATNLLFVYRDIKRPAIPLINHNWLLTTQTILSFYLIKGHLRLIMRNILSVTLGAFALAAGALAQDLFEAPDFNASAALIANGVNVSDLPKLSGLVERSLSPCSIAVS